MLSSRKSHLPSTCFHQRPLKNTQGTLKSDLLPQVEDHRGEDDGENDENRHHAARSTTHALRSSMRAMASVVIVQAARKSHQSTYSSFMPLSAL